MFLSCKASPLNLTGGEGGKRNKGEGETGEIRRTEEQNDTTECSGTYTVGLHIFITLIVGLTGDVDGHKNRGGGGWQEPCQRLSEGTERSVAVYW